MNNEKDIQERKECNNLIHQFLGGKFSIDYSTDWNGLMMAVERIQRNYKNHATIQESVTDSYGTYANYSNINGDWKQYYWNPNHIGRKELTKLSKHRVLVDSKCEAVWCAVVDFIEWFNEQTA